MVLPRNHQRSSITAGRRGGIPGAGRPARSTSNGSRAPSESASVAAIVGPVSNPRRALVVASSLATNRRGDGPTAGPVAAVDVVVGAVVGALGAVQLVVGDGGAPPLAVAAVAATVLSLVARRIAPFAVAVVCLASFAVIVVALDEPGLTQAGPMVALFTVGQRVAYRTAVIIAGLCGVVAAELLTFDPESSTDIVTGVLLVVVSIAGGQAVASRHALVAALEDRVDALRRAQDLEVERRVLEDRLRLAHELHDVIAHTITVVNLQSSVALRHVAGSEPAEAALGSIRTASSQALDELRSMVGLLRSGDEQVPIASAQSIMELVRSLSSTRLEVRASIDEELLSDVAPAALLAAHRVVQEGLTNVLRHSAARRADVVIDVGAEELIVEVHDPGPAKDHPTTVGGFGLAGIGERIAVLGGTVVHGTQDGSGFTLRATIPLVRPA
jgi:signal transduction histidine kinase